MLHTNRRSITFVSDIPVDDDSFVFDNSVLQENNQKQSNDILPSLKKNRESEVTLSQDAFLHTAY